MQTNIRSLRSTVELSEEEKRQAELWRLQKCGSLSFDELFKEFGIWRRRKND